MKVPQILYDNWSEYNMLTINFILAWFEKHVRRGTSERWRTFGSNILKIYTQNKISKPLRMMTPADLGSLQTSRKQVLCDLGINQG